MNQSGEFHTHDGIHYHTHDHEDAHVHSGEATTGSIIIPMTMMMRTSTAVRENIITITATPMIRSRSGRSSTASRGPSDTWTRSGEWWRTERTALMY